MTPKPPTGVRAGIRRLFHLSADQPEQVAAEVEDQIGLHLDLRTEQLIAQGMSPEAARLEALRRFGQLERARPTLISSASRREHRMRIRDTFDALGQDLRYALRGLRKQPGFTAAVILTLGLGIGANATMFGVVDRLLLRPPAHLRDPGETGRVYFTRAVNGESFTGSNIAYQRYVDIRDNTRSFSEIAGFFDRKLVIGLGTEARQAQVSLVSASFWTLFGVRPERGRFFTAEEDRLPAGTPVAVLGHDYWRTAYGGDPGVIGKTLHIGRTAYTIIGVAPAGFSGMSLLSVTAFIPLTAGAVEIFPGRAGRGTWSQGYNFTWMSLIARRKSGVTTDAANTDLTAAFRQSMLAQLGERAGTEAQDSVSLRAEIASIILDRGPKARQGAKVTTWLGGVSILVLLVACANVASLLLARAIQRRREVAVRIALGVSRGRLIRYLLTESLLLAAGGALLALVIAQWAGGALHALLLPDVEWASTISDRRVLLFTAATTLVAGVMTGLAPAMQHVGADLTGALKSGGREGGVGRTRLRASLIALQGAISVVLLVGAGLFVRSLHNVRSIDIGFDADRLVYLGLSMRGLTLEPPRQLALLEEVREQARTLPGVQSAASTIAVPFWISWTTGITVPGVDSARLEPEYYINAVSADYFETIGTPLIRGRAFTAEDDSTRPRIAIVSQAMARSIWPGEDPMGRCIRIAADSTPCYAVVGIVGDIVRGFAEGPAPYMYVPWGQQPSTGSGVLVRTRGPAADAMESVRRGLQPIMPGNAYVEAYALESFIDPEVRPWRLGATMFTLFGALALVLAAVGLFSVISYNVSQRTHEIGVRIALGAGAGDVLRLVIREGLRITIIGVAIGVGVALFAGRFLTPLLFSVSPRDPLTFGVVVVTLLVAAVGATLMPAVRASRVNPNVALRSD